jgi:Protein of unknown function (DUF4231)
LDENHQDMPESKLRVVVLKGGYKNEGRYKEGRYKEEKKCYELPGEETATSAEDIILARCNCLIDQYLSMKEKNLRWSNIAQGATLIFTAAIPVVLLLQLPISNIVTASLSALAAIATGLLAFHRWRENFIRYGYIYHKLQNEKYHYLVKKKYQDTDPPDVVKDFAKSIEDLVMLDVTEWRDMMERAPDQSNGKPSDEGS